MISGLKDLIVQLEEGEAHAKTGEGMISMMGEMQVSLGQRQNTSLSLEVSEKAAWVGQEGTDGTEIRNTRTMGHDGSEQPDRLDTS